MCWTPFSRLQGWTLPPDWHALAHPKKGILPEPHPPNPEARSRWEQQISPGITPQDPDGVWEGSAETRGLSFCHGLFLVHCGTGKGRGSGTRRSAGCRQAPNKDIQEEAWLQERRRLTQEANQPARPNSQVSHKLPAREGAWGCQGNRMQLGRHRVPGCFWFRLYWGSAGLWAPSAPQNWGAPLFFEK